jgi:hypothetical protein
VPSYGTRPTPVTTAGVVLIVLGGLREVFALIALIVIIGASEELAGLEGAGAAIGILVFAILLTAGVGLLQILGGVTVLRQRRRGMLLGIIGCAVGILLALLGLAGGASGGATLIINVLILIGDIVALVLVLQNGRHLTLP